MAGSLSFQRLSQDYGAGTGIHNKSHKGGLDPTKRDSQDGLETSLGTARKRKRAGTSPLPTAEASICDDVIASYSRILQELADKLEYAIENLQSALSKLDGSSHTQRLNTIYGTSLEGRIWIESAFKGIIKDKDQHNLDYAYYNHDGQQLLLDRPGKILKQGITSNTPKSAQRPLDPDPLLIVAFQPNTEAQPTLTSYLDPSLGHSHIPMAIEDESAFLKALQQDLGLPEVQNEFELDMNRVLPAEREVSNGSSFKLDYTNPYWPAGSYSEEAASCHPSKEILHLMYSEEDSEEDSEEAANCHPSEEILHLMYSEEDSEEDSKEAASCHPSEETLHLPSWYKSRERSFQNELDLRVLEDCYNSKQDLLHEERVVYYAGSHPSYPIYIEDSETEGDHSFDGNSAFLQGGWVIGEAIYNTELFL